MHPMKLRLWLATLLVLSIGRVSRAIDLYSGPLGTAPNVHRAAQAGTLELEDFSETTMISRFRAAAMGIPFIPTRVLKATGMA